eukprot:6916569-Alexandrium_andersonii.AAC.1
MAALEALREEIADLAREQRAAGVAFLAQPETAIAATRAVQASHVWAKGGRRVAFVYSVPRAWDRKRVAR